MCKSRKTNTQSGEAMVDVEYGYVGAQSYNKYYEIKF